jgi:sulfur-carrier protein
LRAETSFDVREGQAIMQVKVKLFATLRRSVAWASGEPMDIALPEGATIADLIATLELPSDQVKVIFVNGRARSEDWRLTTGDEIGIFPPIGGG